MAIVDDETARAANDARADYVLTPANTPRKLEAWKRLYRLEVGPPPDGSVPLKVCEA